MPNLQDEQLHREIRTDKETPQRTWEWRNGMETKKRERLESVECTHKKVERSRPEVHRLRLAERNRGMTGVLGALAELEVEAEAEAEV